MKVLVGTFNQEMALVGVFSMTVKTSPMVRLQLYFRAVVRVTAQWRLYYNSSAAGLGLGLTKKFSQSYSLLIVLAAIFIVGL